MRAITLEVPATDCGSCRLEVDGECVVDGEPCGFGHGSPPPAGGQRRHRCVRRLSAGPDSCGRTDLICSARHGATGRRTLTCAAHVAEGPGSIITQERPR